MLGFDISLWHQVDDRNKPQPQRQGFIAGWETGWGGIDWLYRLKKEGRAAFLGGNGYPEWYTAPAGVLAAVLGAGPPRYEGGVTVGEDYVLPAGWNGPTDGRLADLAGCPPDEELLIEVWDLS